MAAHIEASIVIDRPVEDVFDYVLNLHENGPTWAPDLESVKKTTDGPVGAGTEFAQVQNVTGMRRHTSLKFTDVEPNQSIKADAELGPISPHVTMRFSEAGEGTRVTLSGDANPKGLFKLLSPVVAKRGTKMWEARFASLKQVLEA